MPGSSELQNLQRRVTQLEENWTAANASLANIKTRLTEIEEALQLRLQADQAHAVTPAKPTHKPGK